MFTVVERSSKINVLMLIAPEINLKDYISESLTGDTQLLCYCSKSFK